MKRRDFLAGIGTATLAAWAGRNPAAHAAARKATEGLNRERTLLRNQNRSTVACRNGIVCASQPLAGAAGLAILQAGGNAVDAAICANAMLGLVEPMSCGPGGDLFALVWIEKEGKLFGLNASGRAPFEWNLEEAKRLGLEGIPGQSPLSWSVPGCAGGW